MMVDCNFKEDMGTNIKGCNLGLFSLLLSSLKMAILRLELIFWEWKEAVKTTYTHYRLES